AVGGRERRERVRPEERDVGRGGARRKQANAERENRQEKEPVGFLFGFHGTLLLLPLKTRGVWRIKRSVSGSVHWTFVKCLSGAANARDAGAKDPRINNRAGPLGPALQDSRLAGF